MSQTVLETTDGKGILIGTEVLEQITVAATEYYAACVEKHMNTITTDEDKELFRQWLNREIGSNEVSVSREVEAAIYGMVADGCG